MREAELRDRVDRLRLGDAFEERVGRLVDGLDEGIGGDEVVGGLDAREHLGRVGAALRGELVQAVLDGGEAALDRPGRAVVQRAAPPRGGDDLRNPPAHLPRADDENMLELHGRRLSAHRTAGSSYGYETVTTSTPTGRRSGRSRDTLVLVAATGLGDEVGLRGPFAVAEELGQLVLEAAAVASPPEEQRGRHDDDEEEGERPPREPAGAMG